MGLAVDYFFAPQSPWSYLGHDRFAAMAREANADIRVRPVDFGQVFPVTGGLPLAKRAPQRQAYRLVELQRFSEHLGVPLKLHPKFFPVASDAAARLIIAVDQQDGSAAAMDLAGAVMRGVWVDELDIADEATLAALLATCGLAEARLDDAKAPAVQARYSADSQHAIEIGVFGAPSYVVDGEIFWGQDRLDFLQRRLARG